MLSPLTLLWTLLALPGAHAHDHEQNRADISRLETEHARERLSEQRRADVMLQLGVLYVEEGLIHQPDFSRQDVESAEALLQSVLDQHPDHPQADEATFALDTEVQGLVLDRLKQHRPQPLVVLVSHRPSALAHCPRIVTLQSPQMGSD